MSTKPLIFLLMGVLCAGFVTAACEGGSVNNYFAAGTCNSYNGFYRDHCNGMYLLLDYYCGLPLDKPSCNERPYAAANVQGSNPNCIWGCYLGRCAKKGEILKTLDSTYVEGTCLDTDKDAEHENGINPGVEGICIDAAGNYYIERCDGGSIVVEYYCDGDECKKEGSSITFCGGGCKEGACQYLDTTASGCCLNPKTVACDWIERREDCCPADPSKYAGAGEKGPKTAAECTSDAWFYKTEIKSVCAEIDATNLPNARYCDTGCCCRRNPDGIVEYEIAPSLSCPWWVSLEDADQAGGCSAEFCDELVPGSTSDIPGTTDSSVSTTTSVEDAGPPDPLFGSWGIFVLLLIAFVLAIIFFSKFLL